MRILSYILLLIVIILGITFATLNAEPVALNYYVGKDNIPLSLLLAYTLIVGCILGLFVGLCIYFKIKSENHRLKGRIKLVEKEVENLRAIPLKNEH